MTSATGRTWGWKYPGDMARRSWRRFTGTIEVELGFSVRQASSWRLNLTVRGVRSASHRSTIRAVQDAGAAERLCDSRHVDLSGHRSHVLRRNHAGLHDQPPHLLPCIRDGKQHAQPAARCDQHAGAAGEQLHDGDGSVVGADQPQTAAEYLPDAYN